MNLSEKDIVGGHPLENTNIEELEKAPADGAPPEEAAPQAAPVEAPKPVEQSNHVYFNGRKLTVDELAAYTAQLEQDRSRLQQYEPKEQVPQKKYSDLMFEDPEAYTNQILQIAEEKATQKLMQKEQQKNIESKFYSLYNDLKGKEWVVESATNYLTAQNKFRNLSEDDALRLVGEEARRRVVSLRQDSGTKETLSSRSASVMPGSSNPVPNVPNKVEVVDFASQLKNLRNRKR